MRKTKLVIIRLTEQEKQGLQEKADQIGMSITDLIRHGLKTIQALN
jgi:antitoxin component of RelBE/YafQ-DinJ toxin-antitoxin module